MPPRNGLRDAVDVATRWLATDVARSLAVPAQRGWVVPVAELDDHLDDPGALRAFLVAVRDARDRPWPRLIALRWHDHYTGLVAFANGSAALFDPHHGAQPRRYAPPPESVVREVWPRLTWAVPSAHGPSQSEPADTLCMVWVTLYFAGHWRPRLGLRGALAYLQRTVRTHGADLLAYAREDEGYAQGPAGRLARPPAPASTAREARQRVDTLLRATVTALRRI